MSVPAPLHSRCSKTDAGRAEIKARALPLSRPARNLLLIVDASRSLGEWMALVQGATEADVEGLLSHGLIAAEVPVVAAAPVAAVGIVTQVAPDVAPGASPGAAAGEATSEQAAPFDAGQEALRAALAALSYDQLYALLTKQAKGSLGLIKGYKMVLEIERCANLTELQALALRFMSQLREEQGEAGVLPLRQALGLHA